MFSVNLPYCTICLMNSNVFICTYIHVLCMDIRVNIQFKGHLMSFGFSERIYALCGSEFLKYCAMGNTIN